MSEGYQTTQRRRILEYLIKNSTRHITVEECAFALHQNGESVGQTTIYRFFEKLVAQGRVRKFISEGLPACFQYVEEGACHQHFHLKCINCGKLIHLCCDFLEQVEQHIADEHHFKIQSGRTVFYGTCQECAATAKTKEPTP